MASESPAMRTKSAHSITFAERMPLIGRIYVDIRIWTTNMSTPKSSASISTKPDRAKAATACNNCRQRKLRCNGNTPLCSNCQLHETVCEYAKGRNKSGPPKGFKRKRPATPPDDMPSAIRPRSDSPSSVHHEPIQMATPPMSSSSSNVSNKSSPSPPDHTGRSDVDTQNWSDLIPTYMGPIAPNWLAMFGMSSKEPSSADAPSPFPGDYTDPSLPYSFGVNNFNLDPMLLTPLPSTSDTTHSTPPATHSSHCSPSLRTQDLSNFGGFYNLSNNIPSFATPPPPAFVPPQPATTQTLHEDLSRQYNSSYLSAVRSAHPFAPLFPLPQLLRLLSDCSTRKDASVHASFCLSAFSALCAITAPDPTLSSPSERANHYASAQKQAMLAYFGILSGPTTHDDDVVCTASGLIYLAVRDVFVFGWGKEASTWLWLAADVVQTMPRANSVQIGVQRWFARTIWLWNKALAGCGVVGAESRLRACFGEAEFQRIRDETPLAILDLDEDQRTFSGLVTLCLDLERMINAAIDRSMQALQHHQTSLGQPSQSFFSDITNFPTLPLCQRVRQWVLSTPVAQDSLLQLTGDSEEDGDCIRETVSRILHLIYYGLSIKFEQSDKARCSIKKTSLYVAVTRIVDAADWLTRSKRIWLWPFAEPALLLARDFLLERSTFGPTRSESTASPNHISRGGSPISSSLLSDSACSSGTVPLALAPGERTLLALIRDVFADAAPALDPGSARALVAAQALKNITDVLEQMPQPREPVTKGDILVGIRQLLAGIEPPATIG
ncbi:hypothetical protein SERLA73DRAFT_162561 [Serpula lacrymans var. lacrymans S7.3]|uniref:Zn(2)-C6 fungal-type domain-containing protein n=2 Tax=Serpula lacrymans var. lacrymans TaxID=341189 RepID=F8Q8H4_SERL3|nr:uncharacterized protein SERLADRAFT_417667 [Serpula lacrymans var. lacrymans S7.9]EGN95862.1 hypothetical protein SERLA73DRAFT_162561 [Serpula lacrymans var. lacrymans S7.3]EGO21378.1 hypothetical protein SERLADRAFT_417667 [Serpula lacrymans var. lacrymans S7.9]